MNKGDQHTGSFRNKFRLDGLQGISNRTWGHDLEPINDERRERVARMQVAIGECADVLFDSAPVMMHSIDENGSLVKVNRRWLAAMGYQAEEVLGRKSTDFLTEESRAQAVAETLPLFRETGRAHSIGKSFLRKNGRVLDILLDAVASHSPTGGRVFIAALRKPDDLSQWQQAAAAIKALHGLNLARRGLDRVLSTDGPDERPTTQAMPDNPRDDRTESGAVLPWELLAVTEEVLASLRTLAELEEQNVHKLQNRRQELLLLVETLETTLADLTHGTEEPQRPE